MRLWPFGKREAVAVSPRRATALGLTGGFQAALASRRLSDWQADRAHVNMLLERGGDQVRARARQLARENPYIASARRWYASHVVGTGIKPSPLKDVGGHKRAILDAFYHWTDEADADAVTDFYGLQAQIALGVFDAGEIFVRIRARRPEDGLLVPMQLQLLESEMLPYARNEELPGGFAIRQGVEFNPIGQRVAYHFLRAHPGDRARTWSMLDTVRVPAEDVIHVRTVERPGQVRGLSHILPSMIRAHLLDGYDDAEVERKKVAALFSGFIETPAEAISDTLPPEAGVVSQTGGAIAPMEPGALINLPPGAKVTFSEPAEVGGSYEAFQWRNLLAIAAGLGVPVSAMTGDFSKANYSSERAAQVMFRRVIEQVQHQLFVFQFCRPIYARWMRTAVLSGAIDGLNATTFNRARRTYEVATWLPQAFAWVDPKKDGDAQALAEDRGWTTRRQTILGRGDEPDEIDEEIVEEAGSEAAQIIERKAATAAGDAAPAVDTTGADGGATKAA